MRFVLLVLPVAAIAAGPTGAIFTTTPDGAIVNENVRYETKLEVYLDGGPGPNAPQTAAGLDAGLYVFQVTDPPGKLLLSQDPAKCRVVEVADGVIVREVPATELGFATDTYLAANGKTVLPCRIQDGAPTAGVAGPSGRHDFNLDADHGPPAIVVQLMPYGTTPNPGGVYKAWMTPLAAYLAKGGDLGALPLAVKGRDAQPCPDFCAMADPGFLHPDVKTDNFKVKLRKEVPPPELSVRKFHDANLNGAWDAGEEEITGWAVTIGEPGGLLVPLFTPVPSYLAYEGAWTVTEDTPAGTLQTVAILDGAIVSLYPDANPTVNVAIGPTAGQKYAVVFGNVALGSAKACKVYDRDADGVADADEPGIAGWKMVLAGTAATGEPVGPTEAFTGADGCVTFAQLLPGAYTITEVMPTTSTCTYFATGPTAKAFTIASTLAGGMPIANEATLVFTNRGEALAGFGTKGYWHNKNGLAELTPADVVYVNGLAPYAAASDYFGAGDEPFDGLFGDGTPVAAVTGEWAEVLAPAGSVNAEISAFLVDSNAGADPREQLAQQLLAFIFNTRHRLDAPAAAVWTGTAWVSAQSLVDAAVAEWLAGAGDPALHALLDALNNNLGGTAVTFIPVEPCAPVY